MSDMVDTAVRSGADRDLARRALTAAGNGDSAAAKAGLLSQIINKETL
ncbi:MAG: hypothetical protein HKN80_08975 [Acidimicrobiia bacterium]|nr:hypothetical protein [Acidimicrobiia bacterium]